jgi:hypothetical protein
MKKLTVITIAVVFVGVMSVGAFAYHGGGYGRMHGGRGRMMYGDQGGMMYGGPGQMQGRGMAKRWNATPETCPCGGYGYGNATRPGWKRPGQQGTSFQMIAEDTVKEAAETYLQTYLSGYTIDKIEKDEWRPLYVVTIKGENEALQQMLIHGFSGQVMHVFPKPAE